ncbi:hypothetical protein, partial [Shigella sp. FC1967]|uniref:hypothetical protein n=1 Tax=Shigella sp. FC1967 TaxID=1898041 RepID=UPI001C0A6A3A
RWGVSFRFGSPCFSLSSLDAHQDKKQKAYRPRFYSVGQIASCHKTSFVTFSDFASFLLVSLHDVKNALRSPQNRSKLSA